MQAVGITPVVELSPICALKAVKNSVEIDGLYASHIRDGAALVEML